MWLGDSAIASEKASGHFRCGVDSPSAVRRNTFAATCREAAAHSMWLGDNAIASEKASGNMKN